jgi:hypothetical protein
MADRKRSLPQFLEGRVHPQEYERWLKRKAASHFKRDRKRNYHNITAAAYRDAIHQAVLQSKGRDFYTGEELDWSLLSQYDNHESESGKHAYKAGFALLPTVDHLDSSLPNSGFCICAWRTNDSKHDLSYQAFIELCIKVLKYANYSVSNCT